MAQNLAPRVRVIAEISNPQNINFLPRKLTTRGSAPDSSCVEEYYFTPQYASGAVYSASSLDALLIQSFYNPDIIPIINLLISEFMTSDGFADETESSSVVTVSQILVPKEFIGREYGKLQEKLIFDKEMVIGF